MNDNPTPTVDEFPWPMRRISTPDACELAELQLMEHDLKHVVGAMKILIEHFGERDSFTDAEQIIRLSLFRDVVVQIVAAFDGTAPLFLMTAEIYVDDPNAPSYLEWLRSVRGSFVAHRAGAGRQCVVGLIASDVAVLGTGHIMAQLHVPSLTDLKHLHDFAWKARRHIAERRAKLDLQVREAALAMPLDEALKLPEAGVRTPRPNELSTSREAFAAGKVRTNPNIGVD